MNTHEEMFVKSFVLPNKQDRYLAFLSSKKGRRRLQDRLAHDLIDDLDRRYAYEEGKIPSEIAQQVREIFRKLDHGAQKGIPCYVICEDSALDAHEMTLQEAEEKRDSSDGIVISVVPGRLAYYRTEDWDPDYILFKP